MAEFTSLQLRRAKWLLNYMASFPDTSRESSSVVSWILRQGEQKLGIEVPKDLPVYEGGFEGGDDLDKADGAYFTSLVGQTRNVSRETLEERKHRHAAVLATLKEQVAAAESNGDIKATSLEKNLDLLADTLGLDATDTDLILLYADFATLGNLFERTRFDFAEDDQYYDRVARFVGCGEDTIRDKLGENHVLRAACIIEYASYDWRTKDREAFNRTPTDAYSVDRSFLGVLKQGEQSVESIIQKLMGESPSTNGLTLDNYAFMGDAITNYLEVLRGALADNNSRGRVGLIYGPPGVGKTVLTAVIGKELGVPVILVGNSDVSNAFTGSEKEPDRKARIRALQRANYLAKSIGKPMLFVFDEAEDVCIDITDESNNGGEKGSKGHFNHLLDTLYPVTIFITNKAEKFDPAYVRRMNPQLHIPRAPKRIQLEIIRDNCAARGVTITDEEARELSAYTEGLSPADITSSVRAVGWRADIRGDREATMQALKDNFNETVKAKRQGIPPVPVAPVKKPEFDFGFKNTSADLQHTSLELVREVQNGGDLQGLSYCLMGPPGSGRRTYLDWLAHATGLEIAKVPYSSLLAPMSDAFSDAAFGSFLQASALDRALVVITNADPILQFPKTSAFFRRMHSYPFPVALLIDATVAEKIQDSEPQRPLPKDPEIAKEIVKAQQTMEYMGDAMRGMFAQMGVPMGAGGAGNPEAMKEFTFVETFRPLGKEGIEYAFGHYFGLRAPASALLLRSLVPYDFECVARKAKFLPSLRNNAEAVSSELYAIKGQEKPAEKGLCQRREELSSPPVTKVAGNPRLIH